MKFIVGAAAILAAASLSSATAAEAAPGGRLFPCVARVVYSEELPYAPIGYWLVRATLEIAAPDGSTYLTAVQDYMPWQGPPPRRGQTFRLLCDSGNPGNLRFVTRSGT